MTPIQIQQKLAAFREDCEARGESIQAFCQRKGLDYDAMYMTLRGRAKGKRGKSHAVFVALGLKQQPRQNT
jgi:gp16 family phage-associated protein